MLAQILGIALVTAFTGILLLLRQSIGVRPRGRWPRQVFLLKPWSFGSRENEDPSPEWPEAIDLEPDIIPGSTTPAPSLDAKAASGDLSSQPDDHQPLRLI